MSPAKTKKIEIEKLVSIIKTPPFHCSVMLDLNEKPLKDEDEKVPSDEIAFVLEIKTTPGLFYIWLGGKKVTHAYIAHECLHLVDFITRYSSEIVNPNPVMGDLSDETRAYLLTYLYEEIQKIMIKEKRYPKE